ncbi:tetratricopeptide repeat protein [Microvirga sp. 3-52]|nr:tetratricopeptide repeat protein [Microvirga sp. 3-52]
MKRRLAAIVCADIAGYSRLMGADEAGIFARLRALRRELIEPAVRRNSGQIIKTAGDGLLIEFDSAESAVRASVEVQAAVLEREKDFEPDHRILFRIGINLGDLIHEQGDVFGDGVNIAARLEQLAEPGTICVSRNVFEQVRDKLALEHEFLGEQRVKNIVRPVETYRVRAGPDYRPLAAATPRRRQPLVAGAAVGLVVLAGALLIVLVDHGTSTRTSRHSRLSAIEGSSIGEPMASRHSIAVLPFANLMRDPEQDYFVDGFTDALTVHLTRISGLFVIARSSVTGYKDRVVTPQEVAHELGIRYVLEGSIRRSGNRLRVSVRLVDAQDARQLWAEQYDRDTADLFAVEDDVIDRIVAALSLSLTDVEQQRLARIPTTNLEAYDYYLRAEKQGSYYLNTDALHQSLGFYVKAISLDPQFADAYAGYARAVVEIWRQDRHELMAAAVARKRAYDAAGRALQLDPDNARAYSVLALLQLSDKRHEDAIDSARKAVAVKPSDAEAYANLGLVLTYAGQPAEAVTAAEKALRLNPAAPGTRLLAGITFYNARDYDRAIEALDAVRAVRPSETVHEHLAAAYAYTGKPDLASREKVELLKLVPMNNLSLTRLFYDYYKRDEDLTHHLDGLRQAGLPDWPFGYRGSIQDKVVGVELQGLTMGQSWIGHIEGAGDFIQQFGPDDRVAYRSVGTLLTGHAHRGNDQLCLRFEGYFLDRMLCGEIYRNIAGDGQSRYVYVSPDALRSFSVKRDASRP